IFIFSSVPVYFLFSRTIFETGQMVALYTGAFYYYLRYRQGNFRGIYPAVILAGLAFYTYVPGQVMVVASAALFFFMDFRYHWQQGKALWRVAGVGLLVALPFVRFLLTNFGQYAGTFQRYQSYLVLDTSPWEKLSTFLKNYATALSPFYWFFPRQVDDLRFVMKGYGHIAWFMLPFAVVGFIYLIRRLRQPEASAVFVPFLAAPIAASLVFIEVTRVLLVILPYSLMACLGIFATLDSLQQRFRSVRRPVVGRWLTVALAVFLTFFNLSMFIDATSNGPRWFPTYGLSGQQFGAPQVFPAAQFYTRTHPGVKVFISGGWIWQGDVVMRFFLGDEPNVAFGQPNDQLMEIAAGEPMRFILKPEEYKSALSSGRYSNPKIESTILCPDGSPCFYLVNLDMTPEMRQKVLNYQLEEYLPVREDLILDGQTLPTLHSALDGEPLDYLFDGSPETLVRTRVDNPFFIEITFPEPRSISGLEILLGAEELRVSLTGETSSGERFEYSAPSPATSQLKIVPLNFERTLSVTFLRLEVLNPNVGKPANIHVRDMRFLPPAP
ncbi:MAG: hypothetical protein HGA86_04275, partial [Anaerolineaceae bacterium]|nr:hypothetical protein [Anaerolineaceae bacterium]